MSEKEECLRILDRLKALSNPRAVEGMARFGINPKNTYGVSIPTIRNMAKETRGNHVLAQQLWSSGVHEARILACMTDDAKQVTEQQLENWVKDFDSWDVCDQCCSNLIDKTQWAHEKVVEWSKRNEEFVKRAGFVLMASLAVHDKKAKDEAFMKFLPIIERESVDNRNYVRKAVNWALRQIGKRSLTLNKAAIQTAKEIQKIDSSSPRWVASDALRELSSEAVQKKLQQRKKG